MKSFLFYVNIIHHTCCLAFMIYIWHFKLSTKKPKYKICIGCSICSWTCSCSCCLCW